MHLEGSAVGTLRPAGAERACMHLVRPLADTPCSRSLPICGRIGVSLSIVCSGLLPGGGAAADEHGPCVPVHPIAFACANPVGASCVRCRCPPACSPLAAHLAARSSLLAGWL